MEANRIELRPYQQDAVKAMAEHNSGICVAPAGSGKTIIAAALVLDRCHLLGCITPGANVKVSWIAHTKEQVQQAVEALEKMGVPDMAACYVSCYAGHNCLLEKCDILIVDECHWTGCDQVSRLVDIAGIGTGFAPYIYGFTATPIREDGVNIEEIIGPVRYEVSRDVIQAVGGVLPAEVRVVEIPDAGIDVDKEALQFYSSGMKWKDKQDFIEACVLKGVSRQAAHSMAWGHVMDPKTGAEFDTLGTCWKRCQYRAATQYAVRENEQRNQIVVKLCLMHSRESVLVLVDNKDHGKELEGMIQGAVFVSSKTGMRGRKMDAFKAGDTPVLICTQLADEGLDVPIAEVLVMAAPGKAAGKVIQRTGRVLRPHPGKDKGIIYEFRDMSHGMLTAQHWGRVRVYKQQGYRIVRAAI